MPYIIQNSLILLAPAFFAATIYMILGRVVKLTDGDGYSIISSQRLTWIFLAGDVFCFALQGGGGSLSAIGMMGPDEKKASMGANMVLAGIALQLIWFVFFAACAAVFHRRMRAFPSHRVRTCEDIKWQRYLVCLYVASALIIVRSIFRMAEYAQGHDGALQRSEVLFYFLDSVLMFVLMVGFNWQQPSEIALLLRRYGTKSSNVEGGEVLADLK